MHLSTFTHLTLLYFCVQQTEEDFMIDGKDMDLFIYHYFDTKY